METNLFSQPLRKSLNSPTLHLSVARIAYLQVLDHVDSLLEKNCQSISPFITIFKMVICEACSDLSIRKLFEQGKTSSVSPILEAKLYVIEQRSYRCDLCSMIEKIIKFEKPDLLERNPLCRIYLVDHGLILSQKDGSKVPPEGLQIYRSEVENIPRISIQLDVGAPSSIILSRGFQVRAARETSPTNRSTVLRGRSVGAHLNMELLLRWKVVCEKEHGAPCSHSKLPGYSPNLRLRAIDVNQMCIVDLPEDAEYTALSYVWGGVSQLRLLEDNFEDLNRPMGLQDYAVDLPKTIFDSIRFVQHLGEKYLWVDALCIIQDNPSDLHAQIQNMNVVYGSAKLTIVAAAGPDSNAGLPGSVIHPRKFLDIECVVDGIQLIPALPCFALSVFDSIWESRGWTMQEKVLSKRLLIFTEHQVFYHCNSATWSEDSIWEHKDPYFELQTGLGTRSPHLQACSLPHRSMKGIRKYYHFVSGYNSRKLTLESDALNAFSGALTAVGQEMDSTMIWGIPVTAFNDVLLWRTPIHNMKLRRKSFPSWTWLGWREGEGSLPGTLEFPTAWRQHLQTTPMIHWHRIGRDNELERIPTIATTEYQELPKLRPQVIACVPVTHLLRFWTWSSRLHVERKPQQNYTDFSQYNCCYYMATVCDTIGSTKNLGVVSLNKDWRESQPDILEFILICKRKTRSQYREGETVDGLDLMLIETENDISYRVQLMETKASALWWKYALPQQRAISLG